MNIIMTFLQPPGPLGIKLSHCSKVKCSASSRGKSSSLIFIIIMFLAWRHFHHYITTVVIFRTITYKSFPSKYVRSCNFFSRFCELLLLFVIIRGTNTLAPFKSIFADFSTNILLRRGGIPQSHTERRIIFSRNNCVWPEV